MNILLILLIVLVSAVVAQRDPLCPEGQEDPIPHPTSCNHFFKCNGYGTAILFQCYGTLEFNPVTLVLIYLSYEMMNIAVVIGFFFL